MSKSFFKTIRILLILQFIICIICSDGIVDFQYTEYTHSLESDSHYKRDFKFQPVQIPPQQLKFPQACNLIDQLKQPVRLQQNIHSNSDIDQYLRSLKQKFQTLLTLTQRLQNSQHKILHLQMLINKTKPILPSQEKINELQKLENTLNQLTQQIHQKDEQLRNNFTQIQRQSNSFAGESRLIQIDYYIDLLTYKIEYLNQFEYKATAARQKYGNDVNYTQFFDDLQKQFRNQSQFIEQLDEIIMKRDKLAQLKKTKIKLDSSIEALKLYINEIHNCNQEKENMRVEFKNHSKIHELILQLKELKSKEVPNNTYCKGVVKKLTQKITSMVRYYAIVYSCASDLQPKIQILKKQEEQLKKIEQQILKYQALIDLPQFEKRYYNQKQIIQDMYSKIKEWKIKQFVYSPQKISQLRLKAISQLQVYQRQRLALTKCDPQNKRKITVSAHLIDLIKQIKQLKIKYCQIYNQYDSAANLVWTETYRYESEANLKNKLLEIYRNERESYDDIYRNLIQTRSEIYERLY